MLKIDYTTDMKYWMICMSYMLAMLVMGGASVSANESNHSATVEKGVQQEASTQHKSIEDCSSISMDELVKRLKNTKAIGFFTKLAIRSDVLGFQDKVKKMRENKQIKDKMKDIKASFDGLLLKIIALLEKDPDLSKEIYLARHSIFKSLLEVQG